MPWGGERFSTADIPTDYRYTGQRFEDDLGIYYYNARWYDPSIGRFLQADTIVPDPGNPLAYDRYAYAYNNPLNYTDPSGHWPDWEHIAGASFQFANDLTLGFVDYVDGVFGLCLDCNPSESFQEGQVAGRFASTVVAASEAVFGAAAVAEGIAAMGPTAAGGAACGALTGGACLIPAAVGLTAEGAMVVGGSLATAHGVGTLSFMANNPVSGPPGRNFASQNLLNSHFEKHGAEFGYESVDEYLEGARSLTSGGEGIGTFTRSNGDKMFYNSATNEFGVLSNNGVIRTYFKPVDGIDYWLSQIGR